MFDRKSYMKKYYQKNKNKLKEYSRNYKKGNISKKKIISEKIEVRRGSFTIVFD